MAVGWGLEADAAEAAAAVIASESRARRSMGISVWCSHRRCRPASPTFLFGQSCCTAHSRGRMPRILGLFLCEKWAFIV